MIVLPKWNTMEKSKENIMISGCMNNVAGKFMHYADYVLKRTSIPQSLPRYCCAFAMLLAVLQFTACSKKPESGSQPAKPTEVKNQTYRMIGGRSVVAIISSDELEIRQAGENLVCKYTKQDNKLRVIVNALGTTTAKYFDLTPQGLVDEDGDIFYEPETFQKITAQIQLNTELVEAVERDDAAGIDSLVAKGAAVESYNNRGTALMLAIDGGLTNAVGALLKNGADPNQKAEGDKSTPLSKAVVGGHAGIVELLLKSGANLNEKGTAGSTPLMLAAGWGGGWGVVQTPGHVKIVSLLCDNKADLNLADNEGNTALMLSLMRNNLDATKILVAAGADRSIRNIEGRDAFAIAKDDEAKIAALQTVEESEEIVQRQRQYPKTILGVWKDQDGDLYEYKADGTKTERLRNGRERSEKWSIKGNILDCGSWQARIIVLNDSRYEIRQPGGRMWAATRVPHSALDAEREKVNKLREMFVGTWRNEDGQFTFNADGTLIGNNNVSSGKWSIDGDVFTSGSGREYKIEVISDTSFILKYKGAWGSDFRGTKVTQELLDAERAQAEAARAKAERARNLLVGTWRGDDRIYVYSANGAVTIRSERGYTQNGQWSINNDILTLGRNEYKIIDICETTYDLEDDEGRYHATRVK